MRLVHLSDCHLGFRQFQRQTPAGGNQREADVAATFTRAIDKVIELAPDLVLIAGDVFNAVRPTNPAILHAFNQFSRLRRELPASIVVIVAGNHDLPRSTESRCILRLFESLGIHVADMHPRRLQFDDRDLQILAVPEVPGAHDYSPVAAPADGDPPPRRYRWNILMAHGAVDGVIPERNLGDGMTLRIPMKVVEDDIWNYVALGHYHVYKEVTKRAYYSGSLDYVSTDVWTERAEEEQIKLRGKVIIERDLATGKQRVHPIPPARAFVDIRAIQGKGCSAADLDAAIQTEVAKVAGGIDGKVVRLILKDVPRHVVRELDYKALRDLQRRALHFNLDARRPDVVPSRMGSGAPGRPPSLADMLRDNLRSRVVTSDIERDALVDLGLHYLREAEHVAIARDLPTAVEES